MTDGKKARATAKPKAKEAHKPKAVAKETHAKKAEKPMARAAAKKEAKPKPKKRSKLERKGKVKLDKAGAKTKNALKGKSHPVFRGRFGKTWIRKPRKGKWDKWRVPRGIDIDHEQEDGARPKIGYRTNKAFRDLHPCGLPEVLVRTEKDLAGLKGVAVRIAGKTGKLKKGRIREKALSMGLRAIN